MSRSYGGGSSAFLVRSGGAAALRGLARFAVPGEFLDCWVGSVVVVADRTNVLRYVDEELWGFS
jgi:hypothetical protein